MRFFIPIGKKGPRLQESKRNETKRDENKERKVMKTQKAETRLRECGPEPHEKAKAVNHAHHSSPRHHNEKKELKWRRGRDGEDYFRRKGVPQRDLTPSSSTAGKRLFRGYLVRI